MVLGRDQYALAGRVLDAGGNPEVLLGAGVRPARPAGGIALQREWVADEAQVWLSRPLPDALVLFDDEPTEFAGLLLAALRLDLPTVVSPVGGGPFDAVAYALGLAPLASDAAEVVVRMATDGGPRPSGLIDTFSLANALRSGVAAGVGPEWLVHLAALAREAGVAGFDQMIRVLASETPEVTPEWLREYGIPGLLSSLGDALHDIPTVTGNLKENLPSSSSPPDEHARLIFLRARTSGAEAVCRVRKDVTEAAGECRVFGSEKEAVAGVLRDEVGEGTMLVVCGCGPRGGPGLLRLDDLGQALRESGLEVPVLTDGLAPQDAVGTWISLFTPEATEGSVLGLLRDGDSLRLDLAEGRIRTGAKGLESREAAEFPVRAETAYATRYARAALPALEGAGFSPEPLSFSP
jgi:dihydroxy-acid dehydratase